MNTTTEKKLTAVAPNGLEVAGTYERTPGRAEIVSDSWRREEEDGSLTFDHDGGTTMFWDGQVTLQMAGETLYLTADGSVWRESQLRLVDEGGDLAPGERELGEPAQEPEEPTIAELSDREHATILAALRWWQRTKEEAVEEHDIATNGRKFLGLTDHEVDKLCERLNVGG